MPISERNLFVDLPRKRDWQSTRFALNTVARDVVVPPDFRRWVTPNHPLSLMMVRLRLLVPRLRPRLLMVQLRPRLMMVRLRLLVPRLRPRLLMVRLRPHLMMVRPWLMLRAQRRTESTSLCRGGAWTRRSRRRQYSTSSSTASW